MEYSKQEVKEIAELRKKYPVIDKLWIEHELNEEDVSFIVFNEIREIMKCIAQDMKHVRLGTPEKCKILNSPLYDNISDILIKQDKIHAGVQKGKEIINPEGAEKEKKETESAGTAAW